MSEAAALHDKVALRVITFIGSATVAGIVGVLYLVHESIRSSNQIDPSTVALVAGVSTLVGTGMGTLGSMLARAGGNTPQAVTVEQPASNPIPTTDSGATATSPPADIHPDAPATSDL